MIHIKTLWMATLVAVAAPFASTAFAQSSGPPAMAGTATRGTAAAMSEGEVRKIDKDSGKITLKHGEIKNLGMPGMTMVFKVRDPALLDKVQVGSKVRFVAESADGTIVVTTIEMAT